jgi:flagellar M-ring protein FliF
MWKSIVKYYQTFNEKQKKILLYFVIIFVLVIGAIASFFISSYENNYMLENNTIASLTKAETKEAIGILRKAGVPITVEQKNGRFDLLTEGEYVERAKLELISNSIAIKSSRGWKIFDEDKFGKTRFENNIDYIRSIEGEIEIALETLSIIQKAKVRAVFPKKSAFSRAQLEPSLSVVITPANNSTLSPKQIKSIRAYLQSSLIGLKNKNLKLLDSFGNLLEESSSDFVSFEKAEKQSRWKSNQEEKLRKKIINSITPLVGGLENVIAEVNINYLFSSEKTNEVLFDPEKKVIRSISESSLKEKNKLDSSGNGGVPGVKSNLQNQNISGDGDANSIVKDLKKNDATTNFEVNKKVIEKINNSFAFIKNIGVSVSFNSIPFKQEELQILEIKIKSLVKSIITLNPERGDFLSVTSSKFFVHEKILTSSQELQNVVSLVKNFFDEYAIHIKYLITLFMIFAFYRFFVKTNNEIDLMEKSTVSADDVEDDVLKKRRERAKKQKLMSAQLEEDELRQAEMNEQLKNKIKNDMSNLGGLSEEDEVRFEVLLEELISVTKNNEEEVSILIENIEDATEDE